MRIIQVDRLNPKPAQTALRRFLDVRGISPQALRRKAEFRRQENVVAFTGAFEPFAKELFRVIVPVGTGV